MNDLNKKVESKESRLAGPNDDIIVYCELCKDGYEADKLIELYHRDLESGNLLKEYFPEDLYKDLRGE